MRLAPEGAACGCAVAAADSTGGVAADEAEALVVGVGCAAGSGVATGADSGVVAGVAGVAGGCGVGVAGAEVVEAGAGELSAAAGAVCVWGVVGEIGGGAGGGVDSGGGVGTSEANAASMEAASHPTPWSSWRIMSSGTRTLFRVRIYWSICSSITKIIPPLFAILRKSVKKGRV